MSGRACAPSGASDVLKLTKTICGVCLRALRDGERHVHEVFALTLLFTPMPAPELNTSMVVCPDDVMAPCGQKERP